MNQLHLLAKPIPTKFIHELSGNDYVAHGVITQYLLAITGPFDVLDMTPVYTEDNRISGAIVKYKFQINNREVIITEVGSAEPDVTKKNSDQFLKNNAELLKDAASDALKRAAMRLGLGLQLWAQYKGATEYNLPQWLKTFRTEDSAESIKNKITKSSESATEESTKAQVEYVLGKLCSTVLDSNAVLLFLFNTLDLNTKQSWALVNFFGKSGGEDKYTFYSTAETNMELLVQKSWE